jgi:superfamily II RNA helicase
VSEPPLLLRHLPKPSEVSETALLDGFLAYLDAAGIEPYPAQEEAFLELFEGKHVILATPTGSGKSLVAQALEFKALAERKRCYYTAPIKALVSEKFFELCRVLGADNVGMVTGDASVHADAPIVCCTAEILANVALRKGDRAAVDYVVMDEFHYYGDRERGVAWQIPLLELPSTRFLLMSATLGDVDFLVSELERRTGAPVAVVSSAERPVPLEFSYRETPIHETIRDLLEHGRAPVYIVHFTQRQAAERAQDLMSTDVLTRAEKDAVKEAIGRFRFDTPFGKELKRWVHHGIGVHHAGLLPKYRLLVERLAQRGHLKLICGTDTLGVGVNVPIRTVLFTQLCKYDGEKTRILPVRDFHQIAGRAGRKGFDERGWVVAQAPEHVIENLDQRMKAGNDPKKLRKLKPKKPPEHGFVPWDEATLEKLRDSAPERLVSRFDVSHGLILNVLARGDDGCRDLRRLVERSHGSRVVKRRQGRKAIAILRSLFKAGVLTKDGAGIFVNEDLQSDFSLNQAASLFAFEAIESFDPEHPDYALDVLTLVESTLEDPSTLLRKQTDFAKGRALARMKAEGMEYDERMAELEKVDRPKPLEAQLYGLFEGFRARHPWVAENAISPKSIARHMMEESEDFIGYVKLLGIQRGEGLLLRYLSDVYKSLVQNVPEDRKTDSLYDLTDHFGALVRQVDSSLLDEWERLRRGEEEGVKEVAEPELERERLVTDDEKAFAILCRNHSFRFVRAIGREDYELAAELLERDDRHDAAALAAALDPYFEEFGQIRTDADARSASHAPIEKRGATWLLRQILLDPDDAREWSLEWLVDLRASDDEGRPVMHLEKIVSD